MGKAALSKVKLYGRIFVPVKNRNQICSCKLRIRGRKIFLMYNWDKWCFKRRICICVSANTAPRWKVRARSKLSNSIWRRRAGGGSGMVVGAPGGVAPVPGAINFRPQSSLALRTWWSGVGPTCTSGRTRSASSVRLSTTCGFFGGICQWNCDQKSETVTKIPQDKMGTTRLSNLTNVTKCSDQQ